MITDKHRINLLVQNIITSGAFENHDIEGKRKIILINIIGIIGIINLISFGIVAFIQNKPVLGFFDLTVASILVVVISYLRKSGYNDFLGYFAVSAAGALFLYLFIAGGVNNTGHLWFYSFPLFASFLLGSRRGAIATFVLFVPSFLLLIVGSYPPITAIYTTDFKIRFIPSFLVVFGISYFFEKLREMTQQLLAQRNAELEETITNQKETQKALRESQEKYQNLVEESFDGIFIQRGHNIIFANKRLNEMLGYREGELIGQNHWVVYHPDYQKLTRERAQARMRGEEVVRRYEVKLQRKDGSWFYGEINARQITFPSDEESGIQVWIKDIMEQKLAEEALRESEERYKALFERSLELVYLCDFEGNFIDANDAALELLGYTKDDIKSLNFGSLLTDDQLPLVVDTAEEILKTGSQKEVAEYKLRRKNGEYVYVESMGAIIYRKGKPYAIQGIARNITDRKQADETLRTSEAQLSNAMNIAQLGYWEYDVANDLFTFDDHFYAIFRTSAEQVGGYKMSSARYAQLFVHPDDMPVVGLETQKAIETTDPNYSRQLEHRVIYADGEIGYISVRFFIVKDNQGRTVKTYGANQNITERKRAEEKRIELEDKLQRAQRMEAMGLMAGGVAHDLNNILSGIVSYPELLLMDLPEDSPLRRPIETIQESGMRAADVVADLLTIARGVASSKEPLNLNSMIEQYLNSPEHKKLEMIHSFVEFKTDLDADLLNMRGSPTHIKKTLMNLIANATEAIEGSGTVTICTKNRYVDEPLKGYENVRIGEYTVVSISDDGAGISREDIERIFEPFYTKKMMGRSGTGLGLAVVWNTVQDHNGYINVNTSEKGTVFELYFPMTREDLADEKERVPLKEYLGHGEKILVVDDEERQREIACGMLTKLIYNAEAVSSGEEAIEYVKGHPVDLILLDMVMPKGINGRETYEEIIKIRPGQKAVIASGYAKTKEVDTAQKLGAGKYIKKPYTLEKIGLAVKEELEK